MLRTLANQLASDAGITLSSVELEDGRPLDCIDLHLLCMKSKGKVVNTTICNDELTVTSVSDFSELTIKKISNALGRLQVLMEEENTKWQRSLQ